MSDLAGVDVITIDGPAGSGKGTLATSLARTLGFHFLDSGILYRVLAWKGSQLGIDPEHSGEYAHLAKDLQINFLPENNFEPRVDGEVVGSALRTEEVGNIASRIATSGEVRKALLALQRDFAQSPGLVADGRDMGTIVFPDATAKIFLSASAEKRAERRHKQLIEKGISASFAQLLSTIRERDERDSQRSTAPLRAADDAKEVETTYMNADQVFTVVQGFVNTRLSR